LEETKVKEQTARKKEVAKKSATSSGTVKTAAPARSAGAASVSAAPKAKGPTLPKAPKPGLRYSDKDLAGFRSNIERSKSDALEELRMLRERLEDLTNSESADESAIYSMHMAEQGSEAIEKEKTYAQIQRIQDYIRKLDEALQRIDEKSYGICRMCGILIAKERLLAVPITTLSASYKIHQRCPEDGVDRIVAKPADALK
jgi:RNA polymerase-binding transcription factor DksA